MSSHASRADFEWVNTQVPHKLRKTEILKKYPEIKKLIGHDTNFKWKCTVLVLIQLISLHFLYEKSWPILLVVAYCFGGAINHILMIAQHEICHNLCFGHARPLANRVFGIFCNLPLGFPVSIAFRKYHQAHHFWQGVDNFDPDLPTQLEAKLFNTASGKICWLILQPFFYAFRPVFVNPLPLARLEVTNIFIQIAFDFLVAYWFGWKMVVYLVGGTLLTMGLHPLSGHFIAEHLMFAEGFETYSYYGPLNKITWNVGYHNEHHDFPAVAGSKLPLLKKIAAEFYDDLPSHGSWLKVIYDFITDSTISPYSRIKRKSKI